MTARLRCGLAALALVMSLGVAWSYDAGLPGMIIGGGNVLSTHYNVATGDLELGTTYMPGIYLPSPGAGPVSGRERPARLLVVPAALACMVAARRRGRFGRGAGRVTVAAIAAALALAVSDGSASAISLVAIALVLAWPLARLRGDQSRSELYRIASASSAPRSSASAVDSR